MSNLFHYRNITIVNENGEEIEIRLYSDAITIKVDTKEFTICETDLECFKALMEDYG